MTKDECVCEGGGDDVLQFGRRGGKGGGRYWLHNRGLVIDVTDRKENDLRFW